MLIRFTLLFVIAASWAVGQGSEALIQNVLGREVRQLDGQWGVVVDPFETGYYNHRYQPSEYGYFRDQQMENPWDLVEYDFDAGRTLSVPGDWNTQDPRLLLYEGTIWYKRVFEHEPQDRKRSFLYFGAANYEAGVYLNGKQVGRHEGGFTPFNFEVTDFLEVGENTLIVKVDNSRRRDGVPTVNFDWWNYGGLTRSVMLVTLPETFVADYFLQLAPNDRGTIRGWVRLDGPQSAGRQVRVEVPEAGLRWTVSADPQGLAALEMSAELTLWTPENPKLYEVRLSVEGEEIRDSIGFRTIQRRGEDILLNGEPIFLRGVSIHEERAFGGGRASRPEDAELLLGWAKDMNCNFVRLAHYPHNQHMLRTADRLGLLVWSEVPVYWTVQFEKPGVFQLARQQVREMVTRDRNRASVVLWSVANETPLSQSRLSFLSRLAETVRGLDPTRLVTAALDTQSRQDEGMRIDDPLAEVVDVIGVNSYCGWYGPALPSSCADLRWISENRKPVIVSEFGGGALQGLHGTSLQRWTEEYQASVYEHNLSMLDKMPFLRGTSPWILKDFRSPRRPLPRIQDFWNRKGLISDQGLRKKAFYIMRDWYKSKMSSGGESNEQP